jgi:hypothetical protein
MSEKEIRRLRDRVAAIGQSLSIADLKSLVQLHRSHKLNEGFLVAVGQRFRPGGIPHTAPKYVRNFLQTCMAKASRYAEENSFLESNSHVEERHDVYQILELGQKEGLTSHELRYVYQLYGLNEFSEMRIWELASQDVVTPAYVCKVHKRSLSKLQRAVSAANCT